MYGYGAEPIAASVDDDDATDTGGWDDDWHDWGDPVYDTHATGYTAPDSLPCTLMTWGTTKTTAVMKTLTLVMKTATGENKKRPSAFHRLTRSATAANL